MVVIGFQALDVLVAQVRNQSLSTQSDMGLPPVRFATL